MIIANEVVEKMFNRMRSDAPWNVDGELLWGYYFAADDRASLESLAVHLSGMGYRSIDLSQEKTGKYRLHVERLEMHTVESLTERNAALHVLGTQSGVEYDGMDVGAPQQAENKTRNG